MGMCEEGRERGTGMCKHTGLRSGAREGREVADLGTN